MQTLIVIGKVIDNSDSISFNLFNYDTYEVVNRTMGEIREAIKAGHVVKGFAGLNSKGLCSLQLNSYYKNIGTAGEKKDGKQYYAITEQMIYSEVIKYVIRDPVGNDFELKQNELINLMIGGAIVAGGKLTKNNKLRVSRKDIVTKVIK